MMNETVSVNRSLFVEDNFQIFRDPDVVTIMDAIKAKRKVKINFDSIHLSDERFYELTVAPYQLHYINATWYLLGEADEYGLMRIPFFLLWEMFKSQRPVTNFLAIILQKSMVRLSTEQRIKGYM